MRHRFPLLAVAAVLASCGSSSASSSAPTARVATTTASSASSDLATCGPAAGRTVAASGVARVYSLSGAVYGCANGGAGSYRLGQAQTCIGRARVSNVVVAGVLSAYGSERCGVDTGTSSVVVRRLTDGKTLRNMPAITRAVGPESYQTVTSLVLKRDGAVAWIATASSIVRHTRQAEVHERDRGGFKLLDSGEAIRPGSLRLHGSRLTWRRGATARHATLD